MIEMESERLRSSRERLKASIDFTRRELREELGAAHPGRGIVLPLVAATAGIVLAWGVRRALKLKGRGAPREIPEESSIDLL